MTLPCAGAGGEGGGEFIAASIVLLVLSLAACVEFSASCGEARDDLRWHLRTRFATTKEIAAKRREIQRWSIAFRVAMGMAGLAVAFLAAALIGGGR